VSTEIVSVKDAWEMADWLAQEAYRLGREGDLAHADTMLEAIRYEVRALTIAVLASLEGGEEG